MKEGSRETWGLFFFAIRSMAPYIMKWFEQSVRNGGLIGDMPKSLNKLAC